MKVLSFIGRWLLVVTVLLFGLFAVLLAYVMHVLGVMQQHKQQAAEPVIPASPVPATVQIGQQPAIRVSRVQFDDTYNKWLPKSIEGKEK